MKLFALSAALGIFAGPAFAQDQDDQLTPERALELLEEAQSLMRQAEEQLNQSSGSLKSGQGVLERIEKLVKEAESTERGAADKLEELIRKARKAEGPARESKEPGDRRDPSQARPDQSKQGAKRGYDPRRADEPSKFRSSNAQSGSWGNLPPDVRRAMLSAGKEEVPPEFQELWKRYFEELEKSAK
jgi:hypothetical protein